MSKQQVPQFKIDNFTCPICGVYAHQIWQELLNEKYDPTIDITGLNKSLPSGLRKARPNSIYRKSGSLYISCCQHCSQTSLWLNEKLIYPAVSTISSPNEDMPEDIAKIYSEAASIYSLSPRSSAALLRLALQMLLKYLGEEGKNINKDIGNLVTKGLPEKVQQAADTIRYIGDQAVHPGTINFNDNNDIAKTLFEIMNWIVYYMITVPNSINNMYNTLPPSIKEQIDKRDHKNK